MTYSPTVDLEEVIQRHSSKLWGCPIFRINGTKNEELSEALFGIGKRVKKKEIEFPKCAFIRAESYKEKLDALLGLISILNGCFVIILVNSYKSAIDIQNALNQYECIILKDNSPIHDWFSVNFTALILVNVSNIPSFPPTKTLLVEFDELEDPVSYFESQDTSGVLRITFGTHDNIKEVDPTIYGFFRNYEPYKKAQETFTIMTYNLYCEDDGNLRERFFALSDVVQEYDPDFICFQSVTPKMHTQLQKYGWWREYFCSVHLPNVGEASNYLLQMSKLPVTFRSYPCSTMRELSTAAITMKGGRNLLLATCSLEGKCETKMVQAQEVLSKLAEVDFKEYHNMMLCGGMDWVDKLDGRFPLPDGWSDAWEVLRKDEGFTCQLSGSPARGSRLLCRVPGYNIDKIDLVGKDSTPTISEHLGLVMCISHKPK